MLHQVRCLCAILVGFAGWSAAQAEMVDSIVATVDTEVILYSELMDEVSPYLAALQQDAADQGAYEREAQKALLESLDRAIEQRILYREAQLAGHTIPDEVVQERMDTYRDQFGSDEEFEAAITESGETVSEFRENLRKQILAISMGIGKRNQLKREAVVSSAEVAQYYQDHLDEYRFPERVLVRRIFLAAGPELSDAARAKVEARLEAIRDELNSGASFDDLARKYSEGPSAAEGGMVGWQIRGELVKELDEAAFALKEGEVSEPVRTQFGYALLLVEQREDEGLASLDEVRTKIEPVLRERYASERYQLWMNDLKKRSRVRVFI